MLNYKIKLPDLTKLTEEEIEQDIKYLAKNMSLIKLWDYHHIYESLIEIHTKLNNQKVLPNLEVKREIYTCAALLRQYGKY